MVDRAILVRDAKGLARRAVPRRAIGRARRARNALRHAQQRRFDRRHGVDTAGIVAAADLDAHGRAAADATHYEATWPGTVRRMIRALHLDLSTFTFVDVGSGKGAALLCATELPFRRAVGIELDPHLHAVATANLAAYRPRRRRCGDVSSVLGDAAEVELPDEPLVLFVCNPFGGETLDRFLARTERSLARSPRPLHVLSFNPMIEAALDAAPWLERTGGGWNHAAYAGRPERATAGALEGAP